MPCDTVATSTIDFKPESVELLKKALTALGMTVTENSGNGLRFFGELGYGRFEAGKLTIATRSKEFDMNSVKRAYSREIVKVAASKFGWNLTEKSATSFVAQKRGF